MLPPIANLLSQGARAGWLLVLILAPWLYGGTRAWTQDYLNILGSLAIGLWLVGCLLEMRRPNVHWLAALLSLGLLAYGWCLALNPHLEYRADFFSFVHVPPLIPWLPGGVDGSTSVRMMYRISVLCGGLWLVSDLSRLSSFRRQLWVAVGITGASIALFGLAQRVLLHPILLWSPAEFGHTHFAGFRYHANAGAYLNLVWPPLVALAVMAFRDEQKDLERTGWMGALALAFSALFVNISKAALLISGGLLLVMGFWGWRRLSRNGNQEDRPLWRRLSLIGVLGVGVIVVLMTWDHWKAGGMESADGRWISYQVSWKMVREGGAFGLGPGTWSLAFPFYSGAATIPIPGRWQFAHEDYLQTLVEWGWLGTLGWAGLILGGVGSGFSSMLRGHSWWNGADRALLFSVCVALCGVFLHALVDFPLQITSIQLYVVSFLGLGWGARFWPSSAPVPRPSHQENAE